MKFRLVYFFAIAAAFSLNTFAQNNLTANLINVRDARADEEMRSFSRPRITAEPTVATVFALEQQAFKLLNTERAAKGLGRLNWNEDIAKVARLHSENMANYKFFSHKGADGKMVDDRADQLRLGEWRSIGENIAFLRGYEDPVRLAVEKWMDSTSHRQNLMSSQWSESAVGIAVTDDGTYYFTQVFLLRK